MPLTDTQRRDSAKAAAQLGPAGDSASGVRHAVAHNEICDADLLAVLAVDDHR